MTKISTTSCMVTGTACSSTSSEQRPTFAESKVVHTGSVISSQWPGIAHGLVVEVVDLALPVFTERAETAGGVEGLVCDSVEGELLVALQSDRTSRGSPS